VAGDNPSVDLPAAGTHVWEWFLELDAARTSNGHAANPVTFMEIQAWASMVGADPKPWEVRALRCMDMKRLELLHCEARASRDSDRHPMSDRPLSSELFDALFQA
jgi:hypothetical protein